MIDGDRKANEGGDDAEVEAPRKDTLEDLDITTEEGADVRGGAPKDKEYEFGSDKPTNCQ